MLPVRSYAPLLLRGQVGIGAHCTLAHLSDIVTFAKTDFFRLTEIMAIVSFANHYFLKSHRNHGDCKFCQKNRHASYGALRARLDSAGALLEELSSAVLINSPIYNRTLAEKSWKEKCCKYVV